MRLPNRSPHGLGRSIALLVAHALATVVGPAKAVEMMMVVAAGAAVAVDLLHPLHQVLLHQHRQALRRLPLQKELTVHRRTI